MISCSYKSLPTSVKPGATVLAADGTLVMQVKECRADSIVVRVMNDVTIGEKKNMNLPGVVVDLPTITDKDRDDLVNFGLRYSVDLIAASFVRKASDIELIRATLGPAGRHMQVSASALVRGVAGLYNGVAGVLRSRVIASAL
jgi:pyruvate kinase